MFDTLTLVIFVVVDICLGSWMDICLGVFLDVFKKMTLHDPPLYPI